MILPIRSLVSIVLALASPLALTVRASADEDEVYSAPAVRSEDLPASASPHQARAARPAPILDRVARALAIDLGPLPDLSRPPAEEDTDTKVPQGHRIGIHRPLPREFRGNLVPHLDWTADADGRHSTEITFSADGAVSLRVAVQATLPHGASVQILDGAGQPRGPAFTPADFQASGSPHAPLWLPSVEGNTLTVQITLPSKDAEGLRFTVTSVAHRFASVVPQSHPYGEGLCHDHVDLACVDSPLVHQTADALGKLEYEKEGSSWVCTGTLLNVSDTPNTYEPYILTANHCIATPAVAATVSMSWFWQGAICEDEKYDTSPLRFYEREYDPRLTYTDGGTELLATSAAHDATLLKANHFLPSGLTYAGWTTAIVRDDTSVFSVHHARGDFAKYAEGAVEFTGLADVAGNFVFGALFVGWSQGLTEPGSSGAGLFDGGTLVGVFSGGPDTCSTLGTSFIFGPFRDFFPLVHQWIAPASYEPFPVTHMLPAVLGAGGDIQGFVRISNYSRRAGEVAIYAIDDAGHRYGPVTLSIGASQTRHFNSEDLEYGNVSKGLHSGVGNGTGMWRLGLATTLRIAAWAYVRTPDGFVTSMHQVAEVARNWLNWHNIPFFNPGSNTAIRSLLRVINPNPFEVDVEVVGWDDNYDKGGPVRFTLAPNNAMQISAQTLEQGDAAFAGSLGDGTGKWSISVVSPDPLHVMSLLSTPSGHLTNLSR